MNSVTQTVVKRGRAAIVVMMCSVVGAAAADKPKGPSRDEFKDIVVYNIFNPDRGPRPEPKPRPVEKKTPSPPRVERLTLTGVILSASGAYGFFDGTDREFQAVRQKGEKLGDFKVESVGIEQAELSLGTNRFTLKLRGELNRTGEEAWKLSASSSFKSSGGGLSGSSRPSSSSSSSSSSSGSGADDERRKKLLELMRKRRSSGK